MHSNDITVTPGASYIEQPHELDPRFTQERPFYPTIPFTAHRLLQGLESSKTFQSTLEQSPDRPGLSSLDPVLQGLPETSSPLYSIRGQSQGSVIGHPFCLSILKQGRRSRSFSDSSCVSDPFLVLYFSALTCLSRFLFILYTSHPLNPRKSLHRRRKTADKRKRSGKLAGVICTLNSTAFPTHLVARFTNQSTLISITYDSRAPLLSTSIRTIRYLPCIPLFSL